MARNLIDIVDLSVEEIDELIAVAEDIIENPVKYQDACAHKQLATLFFEPSTRTRLSFESAMLGLGGSVLGFSEANSSSTAKGETVGDTIHTRGKYTKYESSDFAPTCLAWYTAARAHGTIDATVALQKSCNYFFFELSDRNR